MFTKLKNYHAKHKLEHSVLRFNMATLEGKAFSQLRKYFLYIHDRYALLKKSKECQQVSVNEFYIKKLLFKSVTQIKSSIALSKKLNQKLFVSASISS